jgi:DNA-binding response OmpR family regulator
VRVSSGESFIHGENLQLTGTEQKLLQLFMQHEKRVFGKEQLFDMVWGQNMIGDDKALRVAVSKLRSKLKNSGYTITSAAQSGGYCFEKE